MSPAEVMRAADKAGKVAVAGRSPGLPARRRRHGAAGAVGARCPARGGDPGRRRLAPGLTATLRHAASMHNPVFYGRQRMRASTWKHPRFLHCYDETLDGGLIFPRGLLGTVADLAAQAGS